MEEVVGEEPTDAEVAKEEPAALERSADDEPEDGTLVDVELVGDDLEAPPRKPRRRPSVAAAPAILDAQRPSWSFFSRLPRRDPSSGGGGRTRRLDSRGADRA